MPTTSIRLVPGQDIEQTPTYNSAGYNDTAFGRFKSGLFQKLGGWEKYYPFAVDGLGRALWAWQDLNKSKRLAVATTVEVDVIQNGSLIEITPQEFFSSTAPDFSTTIGSATVTIVDANINNVTTDDAVEFLTPISVGGLILSGVYPISSRVSATSYTIEARGLATATVANGGAVPAFTTTADSTLVSVALNDHAQVVGNNVVFPILTAVGGIDIEGKYNAISITTANAFTINASSPAVSAATVSMNGGNARFRYYIAVGASGAGIGYGLGGYGLGGYGLGGGAGPDMTGTPIAADDWTLDNWGELLLAMPDEGGLYFWGPNSGFTNMSLVVDAPVHSTGMFVSQAQQQVIVYGASVNAWDPTTQNSGVAGIGVYQDPLLIQWSDLGNFFQWAANATTQAGNFRIPLGSLIVSACATKNRNMFWTDLDLWTGSYINQPTIYQHNPVGTRCGLIGKHAFTQFADSIYWMGKSNFFVYSGAGVSIIPCSVWDLVFQDLDEDNAHKCVAGTNSDFTEIWFFYPSISGGTGEPDKGVKYNTVEGTWDELPFDRLAWIDRSVLGTPMGIDTSGIIFSHESSPDADGAPLTPSFTTGYFSLDEGEEFISIDRIYPDFKYGLEQGVQDAQIAVELLMVDYAGETPRVNGPYIMGQNTPFAVCDPPARGRLAATRVSSSDIGSFWRLGLLRFRWRKTGKRP